MKYVVFSLMFLVQFSCQASSVNEGDEVLGLFSSRALNALVKELNSVEKRQELSHSGSIIFPEITVQETDEINTIANKYTVTLDPLTGTTVDFLNLICDKKKALTVANITSEKVVFGSSNLSYIRVTGEDEKNTFVIVLKKKI